MKNSTKRNRSNRRNRLCTEQLENRRLLSSDGVIWGADARLTLSFAPDGTQVVEQGSSLFSQMDAIAPRHEWQSAILKGFQTWARETNGDIGVVADDGSEFGTPGKTQRDPRFGDIRIGSIPLDEGMIATSVSTTKTVDGTWSGDVLFNSNVSFNNLDEVLAVALHEAGHVFGLEHSDDPNSPMHQHDGLVVLNPTTQDIAQLHATYGPRSPDVFELEDGEITHPLGLFENLDSDRGSAPSVGFADLNAGDIDNYIITTPDNYDGSVTVELVTSGISLLTPTLQVSSASGTPLGAASSFTPGTDVSTTINNVGAEESLRVSVQANGNDEYSVGGYSLLVWFNATNEVNPADIFEFIRFPTRHIESDDLEEYFEDGLEFFANDDDGMDDNPGSEMELETTPGFSEGTNYQIQASIDLPGDVDRYRLKTPEDLPSSSEWGRLSLYGIDATFRAGIQVFDSQNQPVEFTHLVRNDETSILQIGPLVADSDYFVEVSAAEANMTGNYEFQARFGVQEVQREVFASGTLRSERRVDRFQLNARRPQLFQFKLETDMAAGAALEMRIINSADNSLRESFSVVAGDTRTLAVFLSEGSYRVVIRAAAGSAAFTDLHYELSGAVIDDPLGPQIDDVTNEGFDFERHRFYLSLALFHLSQ